LNYGGALKTELKRLDIEEAQLERLDQVVYYTDPTAQPQTIQAPPNAPAGTLDGRKAEQHPGYQSPTGDGKSTVALKAMFAMARRRYLLPIDIATGTCVYGMQGAPSTPRVSSFHSAI
jgi:hypothetical protein